MMLVINKNYEGLKKIGEYEYLLQGDLVSDESIEINLDDWESKPDGELKPEKGSQQGC